MAINIIIIILPDKSWLAIEWRWWWSAGQMRNGSACLLSSNRQLFHYYVCQWSATGISSLVGKNYGRPSCDNIIERKVRQWKLSSTLAHYIDQILFLPDMSWYFPAHYNHIRCDETLLQGRIRWSMVNSIKSGHTFETATNGVGCGYFCWGWIATSWMFGLIRNVFIWFRLFRTEPMFAIQIKIHVRIKINISVTIYYERGRQW